MYNLIKTHHLATACHGRTIGRWVMSAIEVLDDEELLDQTHSQPRLR